MCKAIEEMRNETARKTSLETAKSLLLIGKLTCEEIAQATKLTVEEVKELDGRCFGACCHVVKISASWCRLAYNGDKSSFVGG